MLIVEIPIKGQHPLHGGVGQLGSIQINVAKTLEAWLANLATDVLKIKTGRQHLLPIPKPRFAGQKIQILRIGVHIHMNRKT